MTDVASLMVCFDTPLGRCGLVWHGPSLTRLALPDADDAALERHLRRGVVGIHADAGLSPQPADLADAPGWVRQVVDELGDLLGGRDLDLGWVPVDLTALSPVAQDVYEVTRRIPRGQTMTYGEVADAIGQPGAAQAVGAAMGRNPVPLVVPCHRVVGADGSLVGFSAHGGVALKRQILDAEHAAVVAQRTLF